MLNSCTWRTFAAAFIFVCPAASVAEELRTPSKAEKLVASERALIIAHRGDSLVAPENTLPAFRSAVDAGSDLVELDYVHSADGVPVVIHDDTLDRTTDARRIFGGEKIAVDSKPMAELLRLDAGTWFGARFAGTRLPSLEESLDEIQAGSVTLIERKQGDAKTCVELLKRKELLNDVVVQAFDWQFLIDCHELAPDLVLGALGVGEINDRTIAKAKETGAKAIGWQESQLNAERIAKLHDAGFMVWAWTIDRSERAKELLDAGVDGVITNSPAKIKTLLTTAN